MTIASLSYKHIPSPVGELTLIASTKGICGLYFSCEDSLAYFTAMEAQGTLARDDANHLLNHAEQQLEEYFAGKRRDFKLALDMQGTVFQIKAWRELQNIPYGQTISYGEQAARMGDAKKARAAGTANGSNPISIIVPCHRVIGAAKGLTGYAGGLGNKKFLLELEQKHCA